MHKISGSWIFSVIKAFGPEVHDRLEVRSRLMHFEVVADGTYENAVVNFGSPYIRDALVSRYEEGFGLVLQRFMNEHRVNPLN
jgi:hypothetical protein